MYLIYNETGRALKLKTTTSEAGNVAELQLGIADENGGYDVFNTITTMTDAGLIDIITGFCEKCKDITNKTSRFFFRHPEKKIVSYNPVNCEVVTFDKSETVNDSKDNKGKMLAKNPRNCVIMVLNNASSVKVNYTVMSGHVPAKTIQVGDFKILVMFVRANNWATQDNARDKKANYIYVDGCEGKKQIKLSFVNAGPDKKYTTNSLVEEVFEGETFPVEPKPKKPFHKKTTTDDRPQKNFHGERNRTYVNTRPANTTTPKEYNFDEFEDNNRGGKHGGKQRYNNNSKKHNRRNSKFEDGYN